MNGVKHDMGELFAGKLHVFLTEIYKNVCGNGLTHDRYSKLIEQHFSIENIEFMPEEVLNYMVYENQTELKQSKVSSLLVRIINRDVSFLSIDSKRLTVMVMQTGDNKAVKAMLNQLFIRSKAGVWNSYDTTIAIAYLLQSAFEHNELLGVIYENSPALYFYYSYGCKTSFICQIREEKSNRYLRCIDNDKKAAFLYFMSVCEKNRANFLGAYAYYKNFFDRVSADMAFKAGIDPKCKKPNYKRYYKEGDLKRLYDGIKDYDVVISKAHQLRNENPLSHSSSGLIDRDSSSRELMDAEQELDNLINQYSSNKKL